MEQTINNIRKEVAYHQAKCEHDQASQDAGGILFNLGYLVGLERAVALLEGGEPIADEVIQAQREGRKTGQRGGGINADPTTWDDYAIWIGDSLVGTGEPTFILRCRSGMQLYAVVSVLQAALGPDKFVSMGGWRE